MVNLSSFEIFQMNFPKSLLENEELICYYNFEHFKNQFIKFNKPITCFFILWAITNLKRDKFYNLNSKIQEKLKN